MALMAKKPEGSNYPPVSQALHQAVCYAVYDLGTQFEEKFGKAVHKVLLGWEIPSERIEVDRDGIKLNLPRAISKRYTMSLHEKANLRKDLESWRGKAFTDEEAQGFDLKRLLGANCMVQVIHKTKDGKTFANVTNVVQLPKGMEKRTLENPIQYFSFEEHQGETPINTPQWIMDIIKASSEWAQITRGEIPGEDEGESFGDDSQILDDDIPF